MNIPKDRRYTKDHEWIKMDGDVAVIGITDFAQGELGDVVFIDIGTVDQSLDKEAVFGTIEAVKTVSDLFMPIKGKVLEVNKAVADDPALVNKDPFGEGWMVRVQPDGPMDEEGLMSAEAYEALVS